MSNRLTIRTRSESLASHILPVSGTMIGVCATLIGLVKLAEAKHGSSHVDEYAAMAAITFLASALLLHSGWFGSKYWIVGAGGWRPVHR